MPGSKEGEFDFPKGLTVDNRYVYICDWYNHRVQILTKDNGIYVSQLGNGKSSEQFEYPYSLYNHVSEEVIYVGDAPSVQLFREGICIQRLGNECGNQMNQFDGILSICVVDDRLYLSDCYNARIQIFKRVES